MRSDRRRWGRCLQLLWASTCCSAPEGDSDSQAGAAEPWQGLSGLWREKESTLPNAARHLLWLEYGTSQDGQKKQREAYEKFLDLARLLSGDAELEGASSLAELGAGWEGCWGRRGGSSRRRPREGGGRRLFLGSQDTGLALQRLGSQEQSSSGPEAKPGSRRESRPSVWGALAYPPSGVSQQPPWKQGQLVKGDVGRSELSPGQRSGSHKGASPPTPRAGQRSSRAPFSGLLTAWPLVGPV